jgi:hypothetical protein
MAAVKKSSRVSPTTRLLGPGVLSAAKAEIDAIIRVVQKATSLEPNTGRRARIFMELIFVKAAGNRI